MGAFHRQKMKKAVITISIHEDYELNDSGCYRIHRLEENLYEGYLPKDYNCHDIITYQWQQNRAERLKGHFSFYYTLSKNYVSRGSMFLYMVLLIAVSVLGDLIANVVWSMKDMFN